MATKNFKSGTAYNKWLAYGHASGAFKRSSGHQKVKIKGKDKKVKHAGGGYRSRYAVGGMYAANTVQAAGQGGIGSTSNIVYQEQGTELQDKRLEAMKIEEERLAQESLLAEQEVKEIKQQGEIDVQEEAIKQQQSDVAVKTAAKTLAAPFRTVKSKVGLGQVLKQASEAFKVQKATNLAIKSGQLMQSSAGTATGAGLRSLGTGLKSFASSGAGIGMIGTIAGEGIKKAWGDDDPTTATFADIGGQALSSAGTGASIGSLFGPVGTAVGAIGGALYGAGKAVFGARKARRVQKRADRKERRRIRKHNKALAKSFGTQVSQVRGGELSSKTYSGYDYGRNVAAKLGGMRMGIPRYGYAA